MDKSDVEVCPRAARRAKCATAAMDTGADYTLGVGAVRCSVGNRNDPRDMRNTYVCVFTRPGPIAALLNRYLAPPFGDPASWRWIMASRRDAVG